MEILNVERHGHKIITAESSQRKGILPERLHVFADRFRKKTKSAQSREECQ